MTHDAAMLVSLLTTDKDKKFEPIARMADAIIDVTLQQGVCLPQDLYAKGFTHQDTIEFWHMADAMAAIELKHARNESSSFFEPEARYA